MPMTPPRSGLKVFVNDSKSVEKIALAVPAGVEIAVDEEVAAALPAAFKDPDEVAKRDKARAPKGSKADAETAEGE